jgi:anti-anti-sigma factor
MRIERWQVGTVEVFAPVGALVDQDAEDFSNLLFQCIRSPNPRVVISLQEVPYMDSAAVESLLNATDELAVRAASLKLVGVPPTCREIFELTGVSGRFSFFENIQDAVKSFL